MSGSNIMLKSGDVLFREGEQSDGMYLVRRGDILVYLENGGEELKLAKVTAGAMIGEMALFDKKPRSAAAKAVTEVEVTKISNDDFQKIMKQIPKWFVALMTSLSTRLRETNDRLQTIESASKGRSKPLENVLKICGVLNLLWHKDGTKDAKNWLLDREPAEEEISAILAIDLAITKSVTSALVKTELLTVKPNSYKKDVFVLPNRGVIEKFVKFCQKFIVDFKGQKSFPDSAIILLETLRDMANESAYEVCTITLEDLITEGERRSLNTNGWKDDVKLMKNLGEGSLLTKVAAGVGFKVEKKLFPRIVSHHKILQLLDKSGVS